MHPHSLTKPAAMRSKRSRGRGTAVCHIIHRLDYGGLENGLVNIINGLPADRYAHAIICLTDATAFRERIARNDVQIFCMRKEPGNDPRLYVRIWRLLRRLRPHVVHTRNLPTLDLLLPARLAGVPCLVHGEHGLDVLELEGSGQRYRRLRRWSRPLIDRYVAVSGDLGDWLNQRIGVPRDRVTVIYNGVDTQRFRPKRPGEPSRLPAGFAPGDAIVFGAVGRLEAIKDQVTLARAFVELVQRHPEMRARARLVIVGDGSLRNAIEGVLTDGGVRALAWLPGFRDDVPELYRSCSALVLPSRREGISNTALEAMASGLPVIATEVGGNPEVVVAGETGSLVAPADPTALARAMHAYAAQPGLAEAHGVAGRHRVLHTFSLDAMLANYGRLYDGLTGRFRRTADASRYAADVDMNAHERHMPRRADQP